jgi:hypothetical protein
MQVVENTLRTAASFEPRSYRPQRIDEMHRDITRPAGDLLLKYLQAGGLSSYRISCPPVTLMAWPVM